MSLKSRYILLAGALAAGLALGPTAATPGNDVLTSIETPETTIEVIEPALDPVIETPTPLGAVSEAEFACMAKVIDHEAGNQPRDGQLAVAHVMINRIRSGRFPATLCGVAHQRNQFSFINQYQIREDSARWTNAMAVARAALSGEAEDTSKGALFFHARHIKPNSFFQTRTRVTALEDHIFYR